MIILEWLKIGVVFLVMITILVAAHEYGHYLFARIFKMGVEEFAIGFGRKPLWIWMRRTFRIPLSEVEGQSLMAAAQREKETGALVAGQPEHVTAIEEQVFGEEDWRERSTEDKGLFLRDSEGRVIALNQETIYTVRPWPLGGFVRIKGMFPEDDGSEVRVPGGFYSKAPWKRFFVLLAGPAFSVLAGMVLLFALYAVWGVEKQTTTIDDIVEGAKDGPAAKAGLKHGDVILSIDGQKVTTFYEMVSRVRDRAGERILVVYRRGTLTNQIALVPTLDAIPQPVLGPDQMPTGEKRRQGRLGLKMAPMMVPLSLGEAAGKAIEAPVMEAQGLLSLARRETKASESVGGPISMVAFTKNATDDGIRSVIQLAALLSISVGFFNLLPIHPLDGGQMGVALLEMLSGGKRLNIKIQGAIASLGALVLILLISSVLFIDVNRFFVHPARTAPVAQPK